MANTRTGTDYMPESVRCTGSVILIYRIFVVDASAVRTEVLLVKAGRVSFLFSCGNNQKARAGYIGHGKECKRNDWSYFWFKRIPSVCNSRRRLTGVVKRIALKPSFAAASVL